MKTIKRRFAMPFFFALFSLAVISALSAGGGKQADAAADSAAARGKINVTTSNFPSYDFVRHIAGDRVNLFQLLPLGAESHTFEPAPRDIIRVQNSALFIYSGGESDHWAKQILASMDTDKMKILSMMEAVDVVEEEIVEGMQDDEHEHSGHEDEAEHDEHEHGGDEDEHGHDEHEHDGEIVYDEHVWTSPKNAALIVREITEALCGIDEANADFYRANADSYCAKLAELDAAFAAVVSGAARKTLVFGDRFPFRYFTDAYGLDYFAAFPGCAAETEPSAATVAFLIDKIRAEKIPVVFHIELSNMRMADTISGETGARKLLFHACHNLSKQDFDSGAGYLELMTRNVDALKAALY